MKSKSNLLIKEEGSVLIVALLILVVLTIIGISATTTTEIEIQIAGNDQFHRIAFYGADSGIYSTPKLIRRAVDDDAAPNEPAINYNSGADDFYRQVMGFDTYNSATDINYTLSSNTVQVDVKRDRQETLVGGGAEFGTGAEGVGAGSTGGVAVIYAMDSSGAGPSSSQSNIGAEYRLVPGVAGGM